MVSVLLNLTVVISVIVVAGVDGFKIGLSSSRDNGPSFQAFKNANFPVQSYVRSVQNVNEGPIAGYPKVPPPNAHESGGVGDDLLPPRNVKRSIGPFKLNPVTAFPLLVDLTLGFPSNLGENLGLGDFPGAQPAAVKEAVDPKTGYPLKADPSWKLAGGNEESLQLPLEQPQQSGVPVDPKTGYPLKAQPDWLLAGGNEESLQLPLEVSQESAAKVPVDPKTGYPLNAQPDWLHAGGNEETLTLPLEQPQQAEAAVDPRTGYPLDSQPDWLLAGGDEENLELPLEISQEEAAKVPVDPKTGYPLNAQPDWKLAGGDEGSLELPLENGQGPTPQVPVDPKTGYPLTAEPGWKDAGGNGDILTLPLEVSQQQPKQDKGVDPKTGYPLEANPEWKHSGGDEQIIQLPLEDGNSGSQLSSVSNAEFPPLTGMPWVDARTTAGQPEELSKLFRLVDGSEGKNKKEDETNFELDPNMEFVTLEPTLSTKHGGHSNDQKFPPSGSPARVESMNFDGLVGVSFQAVTKDTANQNQDKTVTLTEEYLGDLQPPPVGGTYSTNFDKAFDDLTFPESDQPNSTPSDSAQDFDYTNPNSSQFSLADTSAGDVPKDFLVPPPLSQSQSLGFLDEHKPNLTGQQSAFSERVGHNSNTQSSLQPSSSTHHHTVLHQSTNGVPGSFQTAQSSHVARSFQRSNFFRHF